MTDIKKRILDTELTDSQTAIFYLGQESILVKARGKYLLFDAYLSDYVDRNCCTDDVKWVRRYAPPITGEELDFVDYVFCSHEHCDHTDPYTLGAMASVNSKAKFIAPATYSDRLLQYGVNGENIIAAYADVLISLGEISVMPIPAAHEELKTDELGRYSCLGYKVTLGETVLFHAGDCCIYSGLAERLLGTDIMLLPVNGRSYYKREVRDIIGNMDASEAAELCLSVGAKMLVPMHFDLYDVNCVSTSTVVDLIESVSHTLPYHIFKPSEGYIFFK